MGRMTLPPLPMSDTQLLQNGRDETAHEFAGLRQISRFCLAGPKI